MVAEQKKLLELLKEIDAICRKHDIVYYLAGGTCIGAVRHKGFLPWDDDLDIYMTRRNWDKFVEVSRYDFPSDRVLLCQELVPTYSNSFGRYCDISCTAVHKHNIYVKDNADDPCGPIIDILQLDPVCSPDEDFMYTYASKVALYAQLINPVGDYVHRYLISPLEYFKCEWNLLLNRKKTLEVFEKELFSYEEETCTHYAMRWGGTPLLFPKEWFQEPTEYQFEDMVAMMPTMNNAYLTMHYGDSWCYVPKKEDREGHEAVFNESISYSEFRKQYEQLIGHKKRHYLKFYKTMLHGKQLLGAKRKERSSRAYMIQNGQRLLREMKCQSGPGLAALESLFAERKLLELEQILRPYYEAQLSAKYIGREDFVNIMRFNHPVYLEVSEEFFNLFIRFCMYTERIHMVLRMLDIKEKQCGISEEQKEYRRDILLFRSAVDDYDLKRPEQSLEKVEKLEKKYSAWGALMKLRIRLYLYRNTGTVEYAMNQLELAAQLYPYDGEYMRYKLNVQRKNGQNIDLLSLVDLNCEILSKTSNGMILLEIKEEMEGLFHEFIMCLSQYQAAGEYTLALEWINKGKKLYLNNEYLEILLLHETEIEVGILGSMEEADTVQTDKKNKILHKIENAYLTSENLKSQWRKLYVTVLMSYGYSAHSAEVQLRIQDCVDYDELLSLETCFSEQELSLDMCKVYGDWLYHLGKTKEAEKQYRKIVMEKELPSLISYQIQKRLGIKEIISYE